MGAFVDFIKGPWLQRTATETGGESDAFASQIADFWSGLSTGAGWSNPTLLERVWVANRCLQMNSNAISTMPLRFYGGREPAWVANPDPVWFPNGIGDAIFAIVWSLYGWGDAFVYTTSRYADGFPSAWTVLNPSPMTVELKNGRRSYRTGNIPLNADDMVQISRDPRGGLRGTSAIASYSAYTNGLMAAADLGRIMTGTSVPQYALKSQRKLTAEQAAALQDQWMTATAARRGAPPVMPPEIDLEKLGFSPSDLLLLDVQNFDAKVIASAFGVPSSMINMPTEGGLNYSTPILALEEWWRTELLPTAFRISGALSSQMLAAGARVEFDAHKFLAPTFADLVTSWLAMLAAGAITVEEFRAAVLSLGPISPEALGALETPASAGASPSQQPAEVVTLRPTQAVNQ